MHRSDLAEVQEVPTTSGPIRSLVASSGTTYLASTLQCFANVCVIFLRLVYDLGSCCGML